VIFPDKYELKPRQGEEQHHMNAALCGGGCQVCSGAPVSNNARAENSRRSCSAGRRWRQWETVTHQVGCRPIHVVGLSAGNFEELRNQ